jgi:hypothetical protein
MILQALEPTGVEIIKGLGQTTLNVIGIMLAYKWLIAPKENTGEALTKAMTEGLKELQYQQDVAMTRHFDQLRRDLEMKIEKGLDNHVTAQLWRAELDRPDRRDRK